MRENGKLMVANVSSLFGTLLHIAKTQRQIGTSSLGRIEPQLSKFPKSS